MSGGPLPRLPWRTDPHVDHQAVLDADGLMVADCAVFGRDKRLTDERSRAVARFVVAASMAFKALEAVRSDCRDPDTDTALAPVTGELVEAALAQMEGRS